MDDGKIIPEAEGRNVGADLYWVCWKDGHVSAATVSIGPDGTRYIAAVEWVKPPAHFDWTTDVQWMRPVVPGRSTHTDPVADVKVRAVLLIPAEEYRGLLREGPCGSLPPRAYLHRTEARVHEECWDCDDGSHGGDDGEWRPHCTECGERWPCPEAGTVVEPARQEWRPCHAEAVRWNPGEALVLAWNGEPVPAGLDYLHRAHDGNPCPGHGWSMASVVAQAAALACQGWGRVVLLNENGEEVSGG